MTQYTNAIQCSIESPFIYHPHDGKVIDVKSLRGDLSYDCKGQRLYTTTYYNGSIVKHNGRIYFATRAEMKPWLVRRKILMCELDQDYNPIRGTERFPMLKAQPDPFLVEDPRLISHEGKLILVYTDGMKMYWAELDESLEATKNGARIQAPYIKTASGINREKNWSPFSFDGQLHYIYSDSPRTILCPDGGIWMPRTCPSWNFGQIRGGTPAIKWGNEYITFYHSSIDIRHEDTGDRKRVYYMGAYTFSPTPPFSVTKMTDIPLMKAVPYHREVERPAISYVVFPSGVIEEKDHFVVSYGCNDYCTRITRISKTLLKGMLK